MTRDETAWLQDILRAIEAIESYVERGSLDEPLVFDAVCMRIVQIGEAARIVGGSLSRRAPEIPWSDVAAMRNHLAHRYFATSRPLVAATVQHELPVLKHAVVQLMAPPADPSRTRE